MAKVIKIDPDKRSVELVDAPTPADGYGMPVLKQLMGLNEDDNPEAVLQNAFNGDTLWANPLASPTYRYGDSLQLGGVAILTGKTPENDPTISVDTVKNERVRFGAMDS